jgi:glycosyltransferase involved in cell wall biosynthesis
MPQPVAELSALVARRGSPLVVSYHADIYRQRSLLFLYRPLVLRILRSARAVITGSERLRATSPLLREAGVDAEVVGYGIDVDRFEPHVVDARAVEEIRNRFGQHVLAVGRLVPYKGFNYLVEAAVDLDCKVVIVGDGVSRDSLAEQISGLGLQEKVHLVGRADDGQLAAHLAAADALVLPSWNRAEAFGIALLEAQASGTPVIATDIGTGTADAMMDGETGLLIPPRDQAALVGAVNALVSDPERREKMGRAAKDFVREYYSLEAMGKRLRAIYERVST